MEKRKKTKKSSMEIFTNSISEESGLFIDGIASDTPNPRRTNESENVDFDMLFRVQSYRKTL